LSADEIFAVAGSVSLTELFGPKGVTGEMQTRETSRAYSDPEIRVGF
jgi:hypothetical protein